MKLNKKGFTLVELLAVIVIMALLMVVAASVMGNVQENAKKKALHTEGQKLLNSANNDLKSAKVLGVVDDKTVKGYHAASASSSAYVDGNEGDFSYKITLDSTNEITKFCITDGKYSITIDKTASGTDTTINYGWSNIPTLPDTVNYGSLTKCS